MMQRLVLAKTLLHSPSLYLLDEPASGMDPASRADLRETVRGLARDGASVLLSSHILSELEDMCTMVGFMREGKLVDSGRIDEVIDRRTESPVRKLIATAVTEPDALARFLDEHPLATRMTDSEQSGSGIAFEFEGDDEAQAELLAAMVGAGVTVKALAEQRASIERVLLDLDPGEEGSSE